MRGKKMKGRNVWKSGLVFGVVVLFLMSSFLPGLTHLASATNTSIPAREEKKINVNTAEITCYTIGLQGAQSIQKTTVSTTEAEWVITTLQSLKHETARNPQSEKIKNLQYELLTFSDTHHLLPAGISATTVQEQLKMAPFVSYKHRISSPLIQGKASEWFCNFATFGDGSTLPIIILPRFIPFLVTPIPRAFISWSTPDGITSVGGLISRTGFLASGQQKGIALGFWGIGFSIFLPPIMSYGIFGYALFTRVTAEQFEFWPPNNPPEVTQTDPADGQQLVPITTTELRFEITDADRDLMSYNVTTTPDIGSGSGGLKPDGTYTIPINGLESLTTYTWHIQVTDGKDTIEKTLTFTTEPIAPILTNPVPADGERDVPMDLPHLQFTIRDYQGDTMEYTIETSPNIGSAHATGVHDGTYTVAVSGLTYGATYRWYVNVTDGTHWTRKLLSFETGYPSQFDPFEFGWHYQKQITINHTQVLSDCQNFPIFISTTDADLSKAQEDGGDIMFMNGAGIATRQYHDLETFDQTTGTLACWVNISTLSSTSDTNLYMYYGNPNCINQQNSEKTWNLHYQGVWHLNNNPTGIISDSTRNNNEGTSHGAMTTADLITGMNGKCLSFDGVDDYVGVPDSSSLKPVDVTLSAWVQSYQFGQPKGFIVAKQCYDYWDNSAGQTYGFCFDDNHVICGQFEKDTSEQADAIGFIPMSVNTWNYLTLTFEDSTKTGKFYINGVLEGTLHCDSSVLWYNSPWDFTMGASRWGSGGDQTINRFYSCALDEVRVLNTPLPSEWITTEYNNQNNPSTFLFIGPEVPNP